MIPCQRELFDIPDDIAYLNCAYTAPLLRTAAEAGQAALQAKSNPWTITSNDFFTTIETARGLFARLIGSKTDEVALIPAVSYGIALAANNAPIREGQEIIVLQDQFPSNIYSWMRLAQERWRGSLDRMKPDRLNEALAAYTEARAAAARDEERNTIDEKLKSIQQQLKPEPAQPEQEKQT